jgi:hypothetical protein
LTRRRAGTTYCQRATARQARNNPQRRAKTAAPEHEVRRRAATHVYLRSSELRPGKPSCGTDAQRFRAKDGVLRSPASGTKEDLSFVFRATDGRPASFKAQRRRTCNIADNQNAPGFDPASQQMFTTQRKAKTAVSTCRVVTQ